MGVIFTTNIISKIQYSMSQFIGFLTFLPKKMIDIPEYFRKQK